MKFPKIVSADISFNYRTKNKDVQSVTIRSTGPILVFREISSETAWSLILAANNIFDWQETREITETPDYYFDSHYKRVGRQFTFTAMYRFKRSKAQTDRMPGER